MDLSPRLRNSWLVRVALLAVAVPLAGADAILPADVVSSVQRTISVSVDSGAVRTPGTERGVAFQTIVQSPGSGWMRLKFDTAELGRTPAGGQPTIVRIMSLRDGAVQTLNARHLREWDNTSAYFNADALLVQIVADPAAPPSRMAMSQAWAGGESPEGGLGLCGANNRALSNDPAVGRMFPEICTAFIIDDINHTMLSAGSGSFGSQQVVQFNVPLSTSNGTVQFPPPEDQYAIDPESAQTGPGCCDVGKDWAYFGCFPNPITGLTPYQAQGAFHVLAPAPPLQNPAQINRITGYGQQALGEPQTWLFAQASATGSYAGVQGTTVASAVDATPGNRGTPIVDLSTSLTIGILTHRGCGQGFTTNFGTDAGSPDVQYALAHPRGVCIPPQGLTFSLPDGTPTSVNPRGGDTIRVEVGAGINGTPQPGTGLLHVVLGNTTTDIPMVQVTDNVYDAVLPPVPCLSTVKYYFSARTTENQSFVYPPDQPWHIFSSFAKAGTGTAFSDTFESDTGWTIVNSPSDVLGAWTRAAPVGGTNQPAADGDGSGLCFVTGAPLNQALRNGSTTLTSPRLDATGPNCVLTWKRWCYKSQSSLPTLSLVTQLSFNDGATWMTVNSASSIPTWVDMQFKLNEVQGAVPTDALRVRFVASAGPETVPYLEAGIDAFKLTWFACPDSCAADLDGSGFVAGADLGMLLGDWGRDGAGDLDGDGVVNGADLGMLLGAWGPCH